MLIFFMTISLLIFVNKLYSRNKLNLHYPALFHKYSRIKTFRSIGIVLILYRLNLNQDFLVQ
jgi:hypothetical protein